MPKLQDGDPATENAKKIVESEKKLSELGRAQYESRMKGKPTPTQEENDLAACGAHILEHDPDGSDPDRNNAAVQDKVVTSEQHPARQNYSTRQTTASTTHSRHSSE